LTAISSGKGAGNGSSSGFPSFNHSVGDLLIVNSTETTLTLQGKVNLTNPTQYSATIPYVDINILANNTILGHATVHNVKIVPGNNTNITVQAVWDPSAYGSEGAAIGRELLSQYISGRLTLKSYLQ
jgi:hypothetical protein